MVTLNDLRSSQRRYKYLIDGSHGWLRVQFRHFPAHLLNHMTDNSKHDKDHVYLEHLRDAIIFLKESKFRGETRIYKVRIGAERIYRLRPIGELARRYELN